MVLVTGATGFLGHNLIPRLRKAGHEVRAVVRPSSDAAFLVRHGVELAYADDITDCMAVHRACQGCRAVIHAAGRFRFWGDLPTFWQTNVEGTANVLAGAVDAGFERFIHISTVAVVGKTAVGQVIDETYPCTPLGPYQRTKLEGERLALAYYQEQGLPVVVLRPGAYYGPWGHYAFNRLFFEEPLKGWRIKVDNGRHITFPVFAPDVAEAVELALENGRAGEIYNISGPSLSHKEVNAIVSDLAGIGHWRLNVPTHAVVSLARIWTILSRYTQREPFYPINMAPYVFQDWIVSSEKARRELGFAPTPFAKGVETTLKWYWEKNLL
ncbi:MAG: NAD-dependent epimerase/dehydratase family protein [Candidatus Promineifilaceae bacterium]